VCPKRIFATFSHQYARCRAMHEWWPQGCPITSPNEGRIGIGKGCSYGRGPVALSMLPTQMVANRRRFTAPNRENRLKYLVGCPKTQIASVSVATQAVPFAPSNYSGGFTGGSFSMAGGGLSGASSSGGVKGFKGGSYGLAPTGKVNSVSVSVGTGFTFGKAGFGVNATTYSNPTPLPSFVVGVLPPPITALYLGTQGCH
jgi:hypothetical protein